MSQLSDDEIRLLETDWPIIAILGQSGRGKSTFINLVEQEKQAVGDDVFSCTDRVTFVEARIAGKQVVLVDTPGINGTFSNVNEAEVLECIAGFLKVHGRANQGVTGILYLHRITDSKFDPTAASVAIMIHKLCGELALNRVMFCTTMWDLPSPDDSQRRYDRLCSIPVLKYMIANGARTATHSNRWSNAQTNAERILSDLIDGLERGQLPIQDEQPEASWLFLPYHWVPEIWEYMGGPRYLSYYWPL